MGPGGEGRAPGLWAPQRRALTTGLVLTITFVASEALAVVTVMPVVARDLGGLRLYGWVFSAFMLGSVAGISVAGREADRRGPAAPFVAGLLLFGAGLLFGLIIESSREASLRGLISNVSVLFLFVVPMISMRLIAEEQRTGTIELLLTNPVQEWQIVTGKFIASVLLVMVMVALTLVYAGFLFAFGNPDRGPIITGYDADDHQSVDQVEIAGLTVKRKRSTPAMSG